MMKLFLSEEIQKFPIPITYNVSGCRVGKGDIFTVSVF